MLALLVQVLFITCLMTGQAFAKNTQNPGKGKSFGFSDLVELIESEDIRDIDSLLAFLPEPVKSDYSLVFASHSEQFASPRLPRVILHGADNLILAFTGNSQVEGGILLEIIEYDPSSKEFQFKEIEFSDEREGLPLISKYKPPVVNTNPTRCAECHGAKLNPIWDGYPWWRGTFGSLHLYNGGGLFATEEKVDKKAGFGELKIYRQNAKKWRRSKRYRHLPDLGESHSFIHLSAKHLRLGKKLWKAQSQRLAQELSQLVAQFPEYSKAVRATLLDYQQGGKGLGSDYRQISDEELLKLLPLRDRDLFLERVPKYLEALETAYHSYRALSLGEHSAALGDGPLATSMKRESLIPGLLHRGDLPYLKTAARLQFLLEQMDGTPLREWSLSAFFHAPSFSDGASGAFRLVKRNLFTTHCESALR